MIEILRHASVRIWLVLVWGTPLGFWFLPGMTAFFPHVSEGTAMAGLLVTAGIVQGLILDLLGRWRLLSLIREGELWEQAGIRSRAERRYLAALRVFDSILVSPWSARKLALKLSRAMAGFYLTGQTRYPGFGPAAARYLLYRPEDGELALLWLDRYQSPDGGTLPSSLVRPVLTELADVHYGHPAIAARLAVLFLVRERGDFSAMRLYRSVQRFLSSGADTAGFTIPEAYRLRMAALLGPEAPLSATAEPPEGDLADEARAGDNAPTLGEQVFSADPAGRRSGKSKPQRGAGTHAQRPGLARLASGTGHLFSRTLEGMGTASAGAGRNLAGAGARAVALLLTGLSSLFALLKRGDNARRYAKYALMAGVSVWLGFFLWNSLTHIVESTGPKPKPEAPRAISIPQEPFTIQVAAYLKEAHAERYVAKLAGKGVSAHVKKTEGGGKTWFLVWVSRFKTRQEAAEFGRQLKEEGKIEDFFVSNT